jgi:ADP-ribose pyrophosphatase YjhB (NUDIX family)
MENRAFDGPRFCPECASELVLSRPAHGEPACPRCGYVRFRSPTVGVAVVLQDRQGRVLMGRRAGGRYAGLWCIPCGNLEWDEDVRDAAAREFLEETGLEVKVGDVVAVHSNDHPPRDVDGKHYPERQTVGIWFRGHLMGGHLHPADGELSDLQYVVPANPPELAFPTDGLVLAQLAALRQ